MTYDEIKALALSYSDRQDQETSDNMDAFLRIVETRVNRKLKTQKMSYRATLNAVQDQFYYGLPPDFNGLRDIQIVRDGVATNKTLQMVSPEQMNGLGNGTTMVDLVYYTIIANQLQIFPAQDDTLKIEIVYYTKLPELNSVDTNNWLSDDNPDAYVFGLMVEISAFAKDVEALMLWQGRYAEALGEIDFDDTENRWSGTSLQVRAG